MSHSFGFVIHPPTLRQAVRAAPVLRMMPRATLKSFLKNAPPFLVSRVRHVRSKTGEEISGMFIACPLLPRQMLELPQEFVLKKIIRAGRIAERLGAGILGLGGYTSIVGDKGYTIAQNLSIPVTTGSSGTAWSACEAVRQLALARNLELKSAQLAVIGATGSIGSLVCRSLAPEVGSMKLVARHQEKLEALASVIRRLSSIPVSIEMDACRAVADADVVVTTTSAPDALLEPTDLKANCIVCDISVPKNIAGRGHDAESCPRRDDVVIVEGGRVKLPFPAKFSTDIGTRHGVIYACMAETILLALEGRLESFSLGDQIRLENVEEIGELAHKHGFEADLQDAIAR